ncbi:alpha/beta hydrolase [Cyanobacterium sp. uoEpiScrs1]|uniref:alpha/beta hydrolase n=1 Tax=Cyanobacterium sp. uoEpiScrs1 TaxID=2976343 RepID=UPI0022698C61|nr:alpha/beta hydrolase [Cyanobacterium sp. uoEpiScrs1]
MRFAGIFLVPWLLTAFSIAMFTLITPVQGAETIYLLYNALNLSVRVKSLEKFAKKGKIDKNLAFYLDIVGTTEEEKVLFREALMTPVEVNPVLLYRFLRTDEGERLIDYFGDVINIQGGRNGKYPLRGSLVQAAFEPEGLSLINILKKLPVNMQIDLKKTLRLSQQIKVIINGTYLFSEAVAELSEIEAQNAAPINFVQLTDIREPGPFKIEKPKRWTLQHKKRNIQWKGQEFYVDVYRPQTQREGRTPVVIISHGLSSRPEDFAKRAEHLASYGYVVALPQHLGSDVQHLQDLLEGYTREIFDLDEFLNRPLDISQTLDELERRNITEFGGNLNLENVGIFGHSFGGYTVLALAGATLDFKGLEKDCNIELGKLNTALLLQCRALKLKRKNYNFRDERIQAVYAINPVNASIFGEQGLSKIIIPTFIGAGNYDPATPFVFEQARSFPWLTTKNRYLLLQEGQAHVDFSQLDAGLTDMIKTLPNLTLPSSVLLDNYTNATMLAFFEIYIVNNQDYKSYLQSSYVNHISKKHNFSAHLISGNSTEGLIKFIKQFRLNNLDTN